MKTQLCPSHGDSECPAVDSKRWGSSVLPWGAPGVRVVEKQREGLAVGGIMGGSSRRSRRGLRRVGDGANRRGSRGHWQRHRCSGLTRAESVCVEMLPYSPCRPQNALDRALPVTGAPGSFLKIVESTSGFE